MKLSTFSKTLFVGLTFYFVAHTSAMDTDKPNRLKNLTSWSKLVDTAKLDKKPIILLIEQRHCGFCQRLKREVFQPLANDPAYFEHAIFKSVLTDFDGPTIEVKGNQISGFDFAESFDANITPTVLFLDYSSNEIQTRLVGYEANNAYLERFMLRLDAAVQETKLN